jgi:predicted AlkP superfamily pyrophosphatase or phosphodiesterase
MRKFWFVIFLLVGLSGYSQSFDVPESHPKLIVGITIDQLRYDALYKLWDQLGDKGFKKMINQGAYCTNARFDYLFTQCAPGYASIVTGCEPSQHGIVSNLWYETLNEKSVHAVQNKKYRAVGAINSDNACSPEQLLTTTLSDEIKLYFQNKSKVYSVSLDPTAAVLSGGFKADAAFWVDDETGKWVSSSYYMDELPKWTKKFNKSDYPSIYFDRIWEPLDTVGSYRFALPDTNRFEYGYDAEFKTFPYDYKKIKSHYVGSKFIKMIPEGNTLTTDFAVATLLEENLGMDNITDVLMVNYNVSENVGTYFGPDSKEMYDLLLRLDKEVAQLIHVCENQCGKNNVLFYLTASSGVCSNPDYLKSEKLPGGRFKHHYVVALLKSYLNVLYGEGEWIKDYRNQQIYLNRTLIEDAGIDLSEVQTKITQFVLSSKGVAGVLTASDLQKTDYSRGIFMKMQNSYQQKRSGDVLIALKPGWIKDVSYASDHNSGYSYDVHVPMMFYGWKVRKVRISKPVNPIDIVPSICDMMNVPAPSSVSGIPIEEISR